ncbi:MAG TPA: LPS export ABC transporter ATP-binding protein [Terriglobales bacterium]|nr:LPS export ABC transporter ATP-binding protein [Terriglobales bacterium]
MQRLSTDQIGKLYKGRAVVNGISITIERGEVVGLLGPNGAGKSTTFHMIVGQVAPDMGRILLDEHDITQLPMYQRAQLGISYLPQESSIFRKLTVEQNLLAILEMQPIAPVARRERLEQLIEQFGLGKVRQSLGYSLSGGERRRVEIARGLVLEPAFILLDEPFSGIDPLAVLDLQRIISRLRADNIGVLITDHNVRETLNVTDRAYIIHDGRIFRMGTPAELGDDAEVRRVYLGESFSLV